MNVAEFYADRHIGNRFGVKGPEYDPTYGHRGVDFNGWPGKTIIPSWIVGRVVRSQWESRLGNVVVLATDLGYVGYCHLWAPGVPVGTDIPYGGDIGLLGNTGSQSFGNHVHITLSPTSTTPWSGPVTDPLPAILAARDSSSPAGGGRPLEEPDMTPDQINSLFQYLTNLTSAVSRIEPKIDDIIDRLAVHDEDGNPVGYDALPEIRNTLSEVRELTRRLNAQA